jgi:hypothetical protein
MGLVRKELVRPFAAQVPGEDAFRFRHQLIRDAAYEGLSKQDRAELHETFAGWLEKTPSERVELDELLGYHLEQAYRYRAALGPTDAHGHDLAAAAADRLAVAGRRAIARDDTPAAARLLERASSLMRPESPARIEVLLDLGRALADSDDPRSRADAVLEEAARRAEEIGDARLQAHTRIELTRLRVFTEPEGKTAELLRVAEQAIPLFTALDDERGLVAAWFSIATARLIWGQCGAQQEALEQALVHAGLAGDPWLERMVAWDLGGPIVYGPMRIDEGLRRCSDLREELPGSVLFDTAYLATQAVLDAMLGNFETARRQVAEAKARVAEFGFVGFLPGEWFWQVEMLAGDPVAAERAIRPEYELLAASGNKGLCSGRAALLAEALYEQGRDEEAESFTGISRDLAASDDVYVQAAWRRTLAKILTRRGAFEESEPLARAAVALYAETDWPSEHANALICLSQVLLATERRQEAVPLVTDALRRYEQKGNIISADSARRLLTDLQQPTPTGG